MNFTYETDIPTEDGEGTETVSLVFKDITKLPMGIVRRYRNDPNDIMWATFEWGLSPEQLEAFDRVPLEQLQTISKAWNESPLAEKAGETTKTDK